MCTTLPEVLVTVMGIEKVVPSWRDMEVFLQLLPRSSTARAPEPVHVGAGAGVAAPRRRRRASSTSCCWTTGACRRSPTRSGARRCAASAARACLNVCPVYARVGGHAYGSVYPGPIGAILTPQLQGIESAPVAAVRVVAVRGLRRGLPGEDRDPAPADPPARPRGGLPLAASTPRGSRCGPSSTPSRHVTRYERAQKLARTAPPAGAPLGAKISHAPPAAGGLDDDRATSRAPAKETFREWWRRTRGPATPGGARPAARMLVVRPRISAANADTSRPRQARPAAGGTGRRRARPTSFSASVRPSPTPAARDIPRDYRTEDERARDEIVTAVRRAGRRSTGRRCTGWREARGRGDGRSEIAERGGRAQDRDPGRSAGGVAAGRDGRRTLGGGARARARRGRVLSVHELDGLDGALTGCALGIAEVGTFVLDGGAGQGRRALSLVPDLHICVVREDQVVGLVPEAVRELEDVGRGRAGRSRSWRAVRDLRHRARSRRGRARAARAARACSWPPDAHRLPRHLRLRRHGARPAGRERRTGRCWSSPVRTRRAAAAASSPPRRWPSGPRCSGSSCSSRRT